jgi:transposase-like protein
MAEKRKTGGAKAKRGGAAKAQAVPRRYQVDGAPDRFEAVCEALAAGNTRKAAARLAGVGRSTLYEWLQVRSLADTVKRAEADAELEMVAAVRRAAQDARTWTAAAWWLERKMPDTWGKRDRLAVTVDWREQAKQDGYDPERIISELERQFIAAMAAAPVGASGDGRSVDAGARRGERRRALQHDSDPGARVLRATGGWAGENADQFSEENLKPFRNRAFNAKSRRRC